MQRKRARQSRARARRMRLYRSEVAHLPIKPSRIPAWLRRDLRWSGGDNALFLQFSALAVVVAGCLLAIIQAAGWWYAWGTIAMPW